MTKLSELILGREFRKVVSEISFRNEKILVERLTDRECSIANFISCSLENEYFTLYAKNDDVFKMLESDFNKKSKLFYCVFVKCINGKALFFVSWKFHKTLYSLLFLSSHLNYKIRNYK